ncbi:hypothetical protein HOY82DRAFT_575992 [Tuber indicum]|nr:hypothetical protein HOY82DRAFT_575992 [Tuber indicum]
MPGLYDELWGKRLLVINDRTYFIPRPQHGFRLGYMVYLKEVDKAFPDRGFENGKEEKVFRVLKLWSKLPCGRKWLLICEEYEKIEVNLLEVESAKWSNPDSETEILVLEWSDVDSETEIPIDQNLDFEIAGQPSSVRRLLTSQPTCYLFDSISHGSETNANYLFHLPEDQKKIPWILTDGALTDERWNKKNHSWFMVLAASPAKITASRQWQQDRNVGSCYMTNWGLANRKPPTSRQVTILFTTFNSLGSIARTCLESISVRNDDAHNATLNTFLGESSVYQHTSHKMAIIDPTHNRQSYKARIVSRWIAHQVFKKAQMESQLRLLHTVAGWTFEAYAHDWFGAGGTFEADQLLLKDNAPHLKFQIYRSESQNYFMDANNLATLVPVEDMIGKYFLPYAVNFESVDGLGFGGLDTLILFQTTIAKSHNIKLHGVQTLCESLPATIKNINLVFVIPRDRLSEYSHTQSVPEARDYRLVFTDEVIQSKVIRRPSVVQDEGGSRDESDSRDYDGEDSATDGIQ